MSTIHKPLTRQQVSDATGLSMRTIDRMIALGELPAWKFKRGVRVDAEGFRRWMEAHRKTTAYVSRDRAV